MSSSVELLGNRICDGDGDTEGVPMLDGVAVPGVLGALSLAGVEIGRRYRSFKALGGRVSIAYIGANSDRSRCPETEVVRPPERPASLALLRLLLLTGRLCVQCDDVVDGIPADEAPWFPRLAHAHVVRDTKQLTRRQNVHEACPIWWWWWELRKQMRGQQGDQ